MRYYSGRDVIFFLLALILAGSGQNTKEQKEMWQNTFGNVGGKKVFLFTLKNASDMETVITNYGGIIVSLKVPDRQGVIDDVTLGFDSLQSYVDKHPYFGALVGRYANRINKGTFSLNGKTHQLSVNNGRNSLHGGVSGFDKAVWDVIENECIPGRKLVLFYLSKDGEEGYPGNLSVKVTFTISDSNALDIFYSASTDQTTVLNLTSHPYFNLAGAGNGDILGHELMINADRFTPLNEYNVPTGEIKRVENTPFDFRHPKAIGERIGQNDPQLVYGKGYDHNWVLNKKDKEFSFAARVTDQKTGRILEVWTTEPGVQFYSGNYLDGRYIGKGMCSYNHRSGFCLETQHFPDSPNQPAFPSTVLVPGKQFESHTRFLFSYTK